MSSYLQFRIGDQHYAIAVENVIEVLYMVEITPVPEQAADHLGVLTLRGRVMSAIDLCYRYLGHSCQLGLDTPLIAVEANGMASVLVVNAVDDVVNLPEDFEPYSKPGIDAIVRYNEQVIMLPNVEGLLSS